MPSERRTWVIVASRDHARRGLDGGFVMANHGQRAPLARMTRGDGIMIYSPTTTSPKGAPLKAITIVGTVTGAEPEPSDLIPDGFRRRAELREIEPLPLDQVRDHLPTNRIRFGFFELAPHDAAAIWQLIDDHG
ncbi:MAG: EVE domain-containing protein [Ilumatobacteraceae bacterium]